MNVFPLPVMDILPDVERVSQNASIKALSALRKQWHTVIIATSLPFIKNSSTSLNTKPPTAPLMCSIPMLVHLD